MIGSNWNRPSIWLVRFFLYSSSHSYDQHHTNSYIITAAPLSPKTSQCHKGTNLLSTEIFKLHIPDMHAWNAWKPVQKWSILKNRLRINWSSQLCMCVGGCKTGQNKWNSVLWTHTHTQLYHSSSIHACIRISKLGQVSAARSAVFLSRSRCWSWIVVIFSVPQCIKKWESKEKIRTGVCFLQHATPAHAKSLMK